MQNFNKLLIIRFSSFGDVTQCLSVPSAIKSKYPYCEIHWVTRNEFLPLIETHPAVNSVWGLNKNDGLRGLLNLIYNLKKQNFTHIYDAHNNLRSFLICFYLTLNFRFVWNLIFSSFFITKPLIIRRSIRRTKRFLLFNFRINLFQQPFSGQRDLLEPLFPWGILNSLPPPPQVFFSKENLNQFKIKFAKKMKLNLDSNVSLELSKYITLAASSAHELKKWPKDYWIKLISLLHDQKFILLGGPEDFFLKEIENSFPDRVFNFAGTLNLSESGILLSYSKLLVSNDTGLLHIAEQLGHPCIALMGPAPFGFPSRIQTTKILERNLKCRPCSKHGQGPCVNKNFQDCLRSILPEEVCIEIKKILLQNHNQNLEF